MVTESKPRIKITYATLRNDNEELHALYEQGVQEARAGLGAHHRNYVDGRWVDGSAGVFEVRSPIDREILVGTFAKGDREDTKRAIEAARRRIASRSSHRVWRHAGAARRAASIARFVSSRSPLAKVPTRISRSIGERTSNTPAEPSTQRPST